jgi:hypothetical protein
MYLPTCQAQLPCGGWVLEGVPCSSLLSPFSSWLTACTCTLTAVPPSVVMRTSQRGTKKQGGACTRPVTGVLLACLPTCLPAFLSTRALSSLATYGYPSPLHTLAEPENKLGCLLVRFCSVPGVVHPASSEMRDTM